MNYNTKSQEYNNVGDLLPIPLNLCVRDTPEGQTEGGQQLQGEAQSYPSASSASDDQNQNRNPAGGESGGTEPGPYKAVLKTKRCLLISIGATDEYGHKADLELDLSEINRRVTVTDNSGNVTQSTPFRHSNSTETETTEFGTGDSTAAMAGDGATQSTTNAGFKKAEQKKEFLGGLIRTGNNNKVEINIHVTKPLCTDCHCYQNYLELQDYPAKSQFTNQEDDDTDAEYYFPKYGTSNEGGVSNNSVIVDEDEVPDPSTLSNRSDNSPASTEFDHFDQSQTQSSFPSPSSSLSTFSARPTPASVPPKEKEQQPMVEIRKEQQQQQNILSPNQCATSTSTAPNTEAESTLPIQIDMDLNPNQNVGTTALSYTKKLKPFKSSTATASSSTKKLKPLKLSTATASSSTKKLKPFKSSSSSSVFPSKMSLDSVSVPVSKNTRTKINKNQNVDNLREVAGQAFEHEYRAETGTNDEEQSNQTVKPSNLVVGRNTRSKRSLDLDAIPSTSKPTPKVLHCKNRPNVNTVDYESQKAEHKRVKVVDHKFPEIRVTDCQLHPTMEEARYLEGWKERLQNDTDERKPEVSFPVLPADEDDDKDEHGDGGDAPIAPNPVNPDPVIPHNEIDQIGKTSVRVRPSEFLSIFDVVIDKKRNVTNYYCNKQNCKYYTQQTVTAITKLREHYKKHLYPALFHCLECNLSYDHTMSLHRHMRLQHS